MFAVNEIYVDAVESDAPGGVQWDVWRGDDLLATFFSCKEDAHDYADLQRLRP